MLRIFFLLFALFPLALPAQQADTLQEVKIEGRNRLSQNISGRQRIDSLLLDEYRTLQLGELLSGISTLTVKGYGAGSSALISYRGTSASQSGILWNGMQINSPSRGDADLSLMPVLLFNSVEIRPGIYGLKEGSGGLGGYVFLESSLKSVKSPQAEGMFSAGSFDTYAKDVAIKGVKGKWKAGLEGYHFHAINLFPFVNTAQWKSPLQADSNAAYSSYGALGNLRFEYSSRGSIEGAVWYGHEKRQIPPLMTIPLGREWQEDENTRATLKWLHYGEHFQWKSTAGYSGEMLYYENPLSSITSLNHSKHVELKPSVEWNDLKFLSMGAGIIAQYDQATSAPGLNGKVSQSREAAYLEANFNPKGRLQAELLGRGDLVGNKTAPSGMLSVFFNPLKDEKLAALHKNLLVHATIGRNVRFPTMNELFWSPGGNRDLLPEKANQAEAGVSWKMERARWKVETGGTAYSNLIDNYIQWTPVTADFWMPKNIDKVWARGLEAFLQQQWTWNRNIIRLSGNYAYTRSAQIKKAYDKDTNQLFYIPRHKASAQLMVLMGRGEVFAEWQYIGQRWGVGILLPDYMLVNTGIGFKPFSISKPHQFSTRLRFKVNNVFNTTYQNMEWRAMPGRWYSFSLITNLKF